MTSRLTAVCLLLAVGLGGCERESGPGRVTLDFRHNPDGKGTPLASFGGDSVTLEEVNRQLAEMSPYPRAQYQTLEKKKEYVESIARFELLAAEAVRRGLAQDPEVIGTAKRMMVQRLLQKELEETPHPITDEQVKAYYDSHKEDYVKPEMIRLRHVFFAAAKSDDAKRKQKRAEALQVLEQAKKIQTTDYQSFVALVKQHSEEERTKPLDGDMRFLSMDEVGKQYGAEVAQAGQTMQQIGQLYQSLVETDQGFHILRLEGRQTALNLGVEQVKTQIQNILINQSKTKRYEALLNELQKSQGYKLDEAALAKIELDLKAAPKEAKGPQPGFAPAPQTLGGLIR